MRRSLALMALFSLALAPTSGCTRSPFSRAARPTEAAPVFDLATTGGPRLTLDSLKGKPTILAFSASW